MFTEDITQPLQCTAGMVKSFLQELRFESLTCSLQKVLKQFGKTLRNSLASFQWNHLSGPHTKSKVKNKISATQCGFLQTCREGRVPSINYQTQPSLHIQLHHQSLNVFSLFQQVILFLKNTWKEVFETHLKGGFWFSKSDFKTLFWTEKILPCP